MRFTHAIVRQPGLNVASGLTTADEGAPDPAIALVQHQRYREALEHCGLTVKVLPADPHFPDGCFVEDAAILTPRGAIATHPGAPSRQGEVESIVVELERRFGKPGRIAAPGTVDGGDVCDADGHFLIGVSARTSEAGAQQLAELLAELGYPSSVVDIRGAKRLLHLKTGIAYLGHGRMLVTRDVPRKDAFAPYDLIEVAETERYAANAVNVNDRILIAAGYPKLAERLDRDGYECIPLDMSEYRKLDGGLSCLSLRY